MTATKTPSTAGVALGDAVQHYAAAIMMFAGRERPDLVAATVHEQTRVAYHFRERGVSMSASRQLQLPAPGAREPGN
ncbi:MAG: hypothetical protein EOM26_07110 [Alphaproteobacteria bacterium]|nr:hypothetical protein [Alphaproteobacteria bacterium]